MLRQNDQEGARLLSDMIRLGNRDIRAPNQRRAVALRIVCQDPAELTFRELARVLEMPIQTLCTAGCAGAC
jgi:hypothetical protein